MKSKLLVGFLATTIFVFAVSVAVASDDDNSGSGSSSTSTPKSTSTPNSTATPKSEKRDLRGKTEKSEDRFEGKFSPKPTGSPRVDGKKLSELKLRSCEAREENIKKRTESLMGLVSQMVGKFDAVASRVEEFYTTKVLPKGLVVSNYDTLVADIKTKKAAVEDALKKVPDVSGFDCEDDSPKELLTEYRTEMQNVKKALHEYRTSVKNLIKAVKEVVEDSGETPKPSATPEATATPTT